MEQPSDGHKQEIVAVLAVLIVVVAIVSTMVVTKKKPTATAAADTANTQNTATTTTAASSTASGFKDGSYTATGSYESPGGPESITVSLTLKNGVVTNTSALSGANDSEAQEYQRIFIDHYKQQVVGKAINSISLSRVSGSSLTSQGFNEAVNRIEQQAKT